MNKEQTSIEVCSYLTGGKTFKKLGVRRNVSSSNPDLTRYWNFCIIKEKILKQEVGGVKSTTCDVYVIVSQTGTVFSELLKLFTRAPYNHVSIALDEELGVMYSFARREIRRPWIAGLIREHPLGGMFYLKPETQCRVYRIQVTETQYETLVNSLHQFMKDYDRYRYNFLGLVMILFGIPVERQTHYACSQFVAYLLQRAEIAFKETHYSLVRPYDFCQQEGFELMYEGRLQEYQRRSLELGCLKSERTDLIKLAD